MAIRDPAGADDNPGAPVEPDDREPGYLGSAADAMDSWGEIDLAVDAGALDDSPPPMSADAPPDDDIGWGSSGDGFG